uniref:Uncharacterized protein n=1 Tax=Arundo donax TaxID=35708 RepID=A0A0A9ET49_ARUDO
MQLNKVLIVDRHEFPQSSWRSHNNFRHLFQKPFLFFHG